MIFDSLPQGWAIAKLEDLVSILDSMREPVNNSERQNRIERKTNSELFPYYGATGEVGKIDNYLFDEELVALGEDGVPFLDAKKSKAYMLRGKTWVNNHAHVLKAIDGITTNSFILNFLNQFDYQGYVNGGTRLKLTQANMRKIPVPLPPLAEQQQIAAKLNELLAQVNILKARLDTIPKILKRFRQSVLATAVSGKLTEDWRRENKLPGTDTKNITKKLFDNGITAGNFGKKSDRAPAFQEDEIRLVGQNECNWPMVRIGAICGCIVPNRDKPKTFSDGYHWLLTPHFEDQSIRIDYTKIENGLSEDEVAEYRAKVIAEDSVVMTCVGRVGLSAVLSQKAVINQQLHAFIPNEYILADFLAYMIRANVKYYEDKATSTTVSYLNKTACNSLPIPLPPIEEQTEIVRQIEQLFTYADQIEQSVKDAQAKVNNLTQSILAKAFRGELTANWREQNPDPISGENSAEALLAKIKAEREKIKSKNS